MTDRKYPPHGSRSRYAQVGCRCMACRNGPRGKPIPESLRWVLRDVVKHFTRETVEAWLGGDGVKLLTERGLTDHEADTICIKLGSMPDKVFGGWYQAGEDIDVYP